MTRLPLPAPILLAIAFVVAWLVPLPAAADPEPPPQASPATDAAKASFDRIEGGETLLLEPSGLDPALLGKSITKVSVRVVGTRWGEPPKLSLAPGAVLSGELVRRAIRELVDSGGFATAAAEARPDGDGVAISLVVQPRRLVAGFDVQGGDLDKNQTLRATGLAAEDEITETSIDDIRVKVLGFYAEHGYTDAVVAVRAVDVDAPLHVLLVIEIEPGEPRKFAQRVFVIDPLEDREVGDLKKKYAVQSGDRLDESELEQADRDLTDKLRKAGFYKAEISHLTHNNGQRSYLYVFVKAGPKLVATFDGNIVFDDEELEKALDAGGKGFADVTDAAARIKRKYIEVGFFDAEVTGEIHLESGHAIEHLALDIRENPRVRVDKRIYVCLPKDIRPDGVGDEIDSFLESELPDDDDLGPPPPAVIESTLGATDFNGGRAAPLEMSPASVFAPDTYAKALKHLKDLYLSRGYLNAVIGPIQVVRARCKPDSPAGECVEAPFPEKPRAVCNVDTTGVPTPEPDLPDGMTCVPDRLHGIFCSPHITLRIPMNLGERTVLYDLIFEGNATETDSTLAGLAGLTLGGPISSEDLDAARGKIIDHYQDRGYAYADVKTAIEPSADRSRARVRFSIEEHDPVTLTEVVVKGATRTDHDLILKRTTMRKGSVFSRKAARTSEERIAQLGTFASVSVGLEDPEVPDKQKRLVVTVTEHPSQYLDPRIGFSTGDGVRFAFEYGHRNIGGRAIALTLRVQLAYLFDFMILDEQLAKNLTKLGTAERLERRNSVRIHFPEFGLGPLFTLSIEGLDVRDNQRDFGLTRDAIGPGLTFRPFRELVTTVGAAVELNDVQIFNASSVDEAIKQNHSLERLLRFPDGRTFAVSQRVNFAWDRRDNPFAGTKGTYLSVDVEHVNAYPADSADATTTPIVSHFMRFGARIAGYVRFTDKGLALAVSLAGAFNVQLTSGSKTYPDRLLYLGGFDTLRGFLSDSVVPQDVADQILYTGDLTIKDVAVRGGDLSVNPRVELRIPLTDTFQLAAFLDAGNLWVDPSSIDQFELLYALGAGLRVNTPIGPLAFDYGFNLDSQTRKDKLEEDIGALHFSIGLF